MGDMMSCNPRNPLFLLCPPPYCLQEGELLYQYAFQLRNVSMNPLLNRQRHSMNSQINCAKSNNPPNKYLGFERKASQFVANYWTF